MIAYMVEDEDMVSVTVVTDSRQSCEDYGLSVMSRWPSVKFKCRVKPSKSKDHDEAFVGIWRGKKK